MPAVIDELRTAVAGFAKFSDDEVKKQFFLTIDALSKHMDDAEYDPSTKVEERTELLKQSIMVSKELFVHDSDKVSAKKVSEEIEEGGFELEDDDNA